MFQLPVVVEKHSSLIKKTGIFAGLFAAFFLLYWLTRDHLYAFDSLLYASVIRRPLSGWLLLGLLTWNHFLWLPVLRVFYAVFEAAGFAGGSYSALQCWNAAIGALLVAGVYGYLSKFIHRNWAVLISCLAGLSHVLWARSTGGEPYLTGTLLSVAACYLLTLFLSNPNQGLLWGMTILAGLAVNFHIANLILLPVIPLVIAGRGGRQNRLNALFVAVLSGVMLVPYILFYDLGTLHGFKEWLAWGSGQVNGQLPGTSATGQFNFNSLKIIPAGVSTLFQGFAAGPASGAFARGLILAGLAAAGAVYLRRFIPQKINWPLVLPPLAFFAVTFVFFSIWQPGNLIYWATPLVFFVLASTLIFAPQLQSPAGFPVKFTFGVALFILGAINFHQVIRPNQEGRDVKPLVALCGSLKEVTPAGSVILISGLNKGFLKVAIPYFAQRQMLAMDLAVIQYYGTGQDPLLVLQARLNAYLKKGIPVYMMDDVLLSKGEFGAWGISPARIEALLKSYRLTEAARFSPAEQVVLYRVNK